MQVPSEPRHTTRRFDIKTTSRGLFGRENEVSTLRSCYERMMTEGAHRPNDGFNMDMKVSSDSSVVTSNVHNKELVYIIGTSGVGKSSLAFSIRDDVESSENGLFVEGKFDLISSNEPCSGIAKAFRMICQKLLSSSKRSVSTVGKMIATELQDEVQTLLPLIPELGAIVDGLHRGRSCRYSVGSRSLSVVEMGNAENGKERWKYAFRLLSRALNTAFSPMCLMLDDLQWADVSSLQVIDFLVSDTQNPNRLMILGCYRSEEAFDRPILLDSIKTLKEKQTKYAFTVTEMTLNTCHLEHVNKLIMAMMSIDDETETQELAKICYKRTLGNPFFVLQFMSLLESESLLGYDESSNKWSWNVQEIKRQTNFISDVVELLQGRMKKLSKDVQLLLQYAACLGTSFKLSTIDIVWKEHGTDNADRKSDLDTLLEIMVREQLIEKYGDKGYKWIHDKVQEAAISLSDTVNEAFKFQIGMTLMSMLDDEQLEEDLFDVVDLINRGNATARPELAALNLRAAEKAESISAFRSAAKYCEYGVLTLPPDSWESHRKLTLDLFILGAKMELALDNSETAERYCAAVFERKDCSVMEKFPARLAVIRKLISGGDAVTKRRGLDMCLETLKELGHPMMWNKRTVGLQAILSATRTVKATKKWLAKNPEDTLLEEMTDPKHFAIMELLLRLSSVAYHLEAMFLNLLATTHIAKMTFENGTCDLSAFGIANIGIVAWLLRFEDGSFAVSCANTALSMLENSNSPYEAQTIWSCYLFCLCWNCPLEECARKIASGAKSACRHGDVELGMWMLAHCKLCIPYAMGQRLEKNISECPQLVIQMEDSYQMEQSVYVKMYQQTFINLQSESVGDTKLEGQVFDSERDQVNTPMLLATKHYLEGDMLFLSSFEEAAERAVQYGDKFQKMVPGVWMGMIEMFHRGVALYAMARKRKGRKYKSRAIKIRKTVKQWRQDGCPYIEHFDLLLDAEHAALSSKEFDKAGQFYQKAIESAVKAEHLQHCGLCCERFADFLVHAQSGEKAYLYQLSEAIRYYHEWGAMGKVQQLKQLQVKLQMK